MDEQRSSISNEITENVEQTSKNLEEKPVQISSLEKQVVSQQQIYADDVQKPKTKRPRSEKQEESFRKMVEEKKKKQQQQEKPNNAHKEQISRLETAMLYDLEQRRQQLRKDNKWSKMLEDKFSKFEERVIELLDTETKRIKEKKSSQSEENPTKRQKTECYFTANSSRQPFTEKPLYF